MNQSFGSRLRHAWDVFRNKDPSFDKGPEYSYRPDLPSTSFRVDKSIIPAIYNRIALDVASLRFEEVLLDQNGNYESTVKSTLTECLTIKSNIDQTGPMLIQDACYSLFEDGKIGIVPVDTDIDPVNTGSWKVGTIRVGEIVGWMPQHVRLRVYNEKTGNREEVVLSKDFVAVVENPFYVVMNSVSSTVQRLKKKLDQLDVVDNQSSSNKLDLIVQLPFSLKNETKKREAEKRRKDIEMQLSSSKYGVAYIDAAEKVVQLNRSVENTIMNQVQYLTDLLYSQLGITQEIMNGTADEKTMLNYFNRTVEPVASAITDALIKTFLTKTGRSQGHSVKFFRDPFKLVPVEQIAEIADKMTRNEIMTSNEVRSIIGYKPSKDPRADELRNKNLNADNDQLPKKPKQDPEAINPE